jgi:hypothetical protein
VNRAHLVTAIVVIALFTALAVLVFALFVSAFLGVSPS